MSLRRFEIVRFSGSCCTLELSDSCSIRDVKGKICEAIGIPAAQQVLIAGTRKLQGRVRLGDALSRGESFLSLISRPPEQALWIAELEEGRTRLRRLPETARNDPDVVQAAIDHNGGHELASAGAPLRGQRELVLRAVADFPGALLSASPELRSDREFVLAAVARKGLALAYASPALKGDREVVLTAVAQHGSALAYAAPNLQGDREFVLAAVARSGLALAHASPDLRGDPDIVSAAAASDGRALGYASPGLWGDSSKSVQAPVCMQLFFQEGEESGGMKRRRLGEGAKGEEEEDDAEGV